MDAGITDGNRYTCTIVVELDAASDPSGKTIVGKFKTKDGGSGEWTAKRWSENTAVPRNDGKIASFAFRKKAVFERLTDADPAKRAAAMDKARAEVLDTLEDHAWFDGAITYIPPPSIGDEYLNVSDLERRLKGMKAEAAAKYTARLEGDLAALTALVEAGKGDVLKKRYNMDADIAKRFCELYARLLKGEAGAAKLAERPAMKPGLGQFHPDSEKHAEHMPDPYITELELMRKLKKGELAHWEEFRERLVKEVEWLTANAENGDKLKARGIDADMAKRKAEIYSKLIKGELAAAKLKERPEFKPNNPSWHPESEKQAEHMPDTYFSAVELDRELAKRDKVHWEQYKEKLTKEVEWLAANAENGDKLKARGLDGDTAKRRVEIFSKIIKGQEKAAKLVERPALKPNPPTQAFRLSGTVMLHPINVRKMLRSGK
jgi:hypothetical protein